MLASRFADETENPEKKMWVPYAGRVFAAGQVLRLGKSAYPDGMPCKSCGKCGEKGGCEAYPIKARCKDYRVWVKAERAKAAAGKRVAE